MISSDVINSPTDVGKLFNSTGIKPWNINSAPYNYKRVTTYRVVGKMRDIFIKGPCRSSKILTMDESWDVAFTGLDKLKATLISSKIYAFVTYQQSEGATVWGLIPDDSFLKSSEESNKKRKGNVVNEAEWNTTNPDNDKKQSDGGSSNSSLGDLGRFNDVIKSDIKGRRWMTAFNTAQKAMPKNKEGKQDAPFAISFIASVTKQEIPFFGRVAWGVSVKNDIVSLTQIPLMVQNNRDQYFTWSFVPKKPITESELYIKGGKSGGESTYNNFKKVRDYLIKECEPLNQRGEYSFSEGDYDVRDKQKPDKPDQRPDVDKPTQDSDNVDNPLFKAQKQQDKNSYFQSVKESVEVAQSALLYEAYQMIDERGIFRSNDEDDPDDVGDTRAEFPSGNPYLSTLKMAGGVPLMGPQY